MDNQNCIYLGIKVKPGPVERCKLENFGLENTVANLRSEAGKKTFLPSTMLELVHHGKLLKDSFTLRDCGVKNGEMVHVVKKKVEPPPEAPQSFSDGELQQIITALRTFGCTPNAPGWTRAMQVLNDDAGLSEITEAVPSLNDDCVTLSILHEVELLAALGANVHTMRRAANSRPALPMALRHLTRMVRANPGSSENANNVPTSGFAYSLEALSEDEDGDDDEEETGGAITQAQLAAALEAATTSSPGMRRSGAVLGNDNLLRMLQTTGEHGRVRPPNGSTSSAVPLITPEMFSTAIAQAMNNCTEPNNMDTEAEASSSQTPVDTPTTSSAIPGTTSATENAEGNYYTQVQHMHEMGLLDDLLNIRALLMCGGDVNGAINLILSGAITDE